MRSEELKQNVTVYGPLFPEPVQIIIAIPMGDSVKLIGKGVRSSTVYEPILSADQLAQLHASPAQEPFDGDASKFRLGVEAMRLGLAYEYDPYFSLSIARVDPLPHQLEAVYDYFIKLPRIRFLLADDPGAGKTIMAGLLIKELKIRGLVKRTLIVTPANLSFQWQRELKDKFRESFEVVRSDVLRANYGMNPWQEKNQVITSVSWVSRVDDAKESLLRSSWDLIIVDEAHKMSAYSADKKTLGEAIRLQHRDVDFSDMILTVRETKFYKTRLVPVSSDLAGILRGYFERKWKDAGSSTATPFLATYDGRPVTHLTAELAFKRIRYEAGVKRTDGFYYQPRLHDFRHTFAVRRLVSWYREDKNVQRLLPHLATYLGHVSIRETSRYLTMTKELLDEASHRFELYASPGGKQ
jgi:integrase